MYCGGFILFVLCGCVCCVGVGVCCVYVCCVCVSGYFNVFVCMCEFYNVWVCVCVGFICGCVYVRVL
jgi:hypothetical protein